MEWSEVERVRHVHAAGGTPHEGWPDPAHVSRGGCEPPPVVADLDAGIHLDKAHTRSINGAENK